MSNNKGCLEAARNALLEYLKGLYDIDPSGEKIPNIDKVRISQKNNLVQAVYDVNENKIEETGTALGNTEGVKEISRQTIYNALNGLIDEKLVEKKFGKFWYKPPQKDLHEQFPILKIADTISITPLAIQDIQVYRTDSQHTTSVANYINACFNADDIRAVCVDNLVLCLDLCIPDSKQSVTKCSSLYNRTKDVLRYFDWKTLTDFDDKDGLTEQAVADLEAKAAVKAYKREVREAAKYGGSINPQKAVKRNVRKKPRVNEHKKGE